MTPSQKVINHRVIRTHLWQVKSFKAAFNIFSPAVDGSLLSSGKETLWRKDSCSVRGWRPCYVSVFEGRSFKPCCNRPFVPREAPIKRIFYLMVFTFLRFTFHRGCFICDVLQHIQHYKIHNAQNQGLRTFLNLSNVFGSINSLPCPVVITVVKQSPVYCFLFPFSYHNYKQQVIG